MKHQLLLFFALSLSFNSSAQDLHSENNILKEAANKLIERAKRANWLPSNCYDLMDINKDGVEELIFQYVQCFILLFIF